MHLPGRNSSPDYVRTAVKNTCVLMSIRNICTWQSGNLHLPSAHICTCDHGVFICIYLKQKYLDTDQEYLHMPVINICRGKRVICENFGRELLLMSARKGVIACQNNFHLSYRKLYTFSSVSQGYLSATVLALIS